MDCRMLFCSLSVLLYTLGVYSAGNCKQELDNTGTLGTFKPQCTEKGHYQLVQYDGSTGYSYCVNPTSGVKIESTAVRGEPSCPACLTLLAQANEKILVGAYRPQCDPNTGLFKPKQNSASTGLSWCADPETGKNLTNPVRDVTLKCTAASRKKRQAATKGPCALELEVTGNLPQKLGQFKPQCTENGNYELIQRSSSTGYSWCANPLTGVQIDGTEVSHDSQPTCPPCVTQLATVKVLPGKSKPQCDVRGYYKPIQINSSTNYAWCVDPFTGNSVTQPQRWDGTLKCKGESSVSGSSVRVRGGPRKTNRGGA